MAGHLMAVAERTDNVWSERNTTPGAIEEALRRLLAERHGESLSYVPARALNLVCIVDREWSGEIANRLRGVGRYHASRTIVCAYERQRTTLDATASIVTDGVPGPGEFALLRETVVVNVGPDHLDQLDRIVDPLVVTDVATVVWAPHGHPEAVDALLSIAQVVLLDSVDDPNPIDGLNRVCELAARAYVVDLAWLRTTPWRERIASAFDPPSRRAELGTIASVKVTSREGSEVAGLLLLGWMCSRLGWRPGAMTQRQGTLRGRARARRGEVELVLDPSAQMSVPGLAGIEVTTASGTALSLERGTGGLQARRRERDGSERSWTVLGASRGEPGILGEGLRQALVRDPTYSEALAAAREMA
jgi:glucose-6-phosphate dehydrogenase assembly protein OpcA